MRTADRDRILTLLEDSDGLSNRRIRQELELTEDRYAIVRDELLDEGSVEKYVCRGGGIRLTPAGEKKLPKGQRPSAGVKNERELYPHLVKVLQAEADEDEGNIVAFSTGSQKARGKWQNPDVTKISIETYPYLRRMSISVTTYEVKRFDEWNVDAVYEAASHHRFAHESWIVLEWPKDVGEFSLTMPGYRIEHLVRECQRFGIGLATLSPFYKGYQLREHLEPKPSTPNDADVEAFLSYTLKRHEHADREYQTLVNRHSSIGHD